ncbi:bacillithiol system redox-active protein YtxJ [Bacillus massilinigeriensis]|uniref:bacillithiol system redox-active protein YtxJ n=1 Tax=Bacillus massilionigeriensis TaxID=1805475 RepID=UPI00096B21D1|nr:bacillithiol system redox-active protein YtxJ [Bacillus massilionigeriensis]
MKKIETIEEFEQILQEKEYFFFLKHSLTCPISQAAFEEYENFSTDQNDVAFFYLAVQEARPLSNDIAEKYEIKHESPQAFLFVNKEVSWHTSHRKITYETLKNALEENVTKS